MSLRIKGKCGLFTYSDACDHVDLGHFDPTKLPLSRLPIHRARVAKETHESTGRPHFHVHVEYSKSVDSKGRADRFDVECETCGRGFHPNYRPKSSRKAVRNSRNYLLKEGNYVDFGNFSDDESDADEGEENTPGARLKTAFEEAEGNFGVFIEKCLDAKLSTPLVKAYWDFHDADWKIRTFYDDSHVRDRTISSFVLQALQFDPGERRSYVLVGEAGVGKTTWVIRNAPKPILWVRNRDALRYFKIAVHKSIVFDEINFRCDVSGRPISQNTQINVCDKEEFCEPYGRYKNAVIPPGIPRFFSCNPWEHCLDWETNPAIKRRCYIVEC